MKLLICFLIQFDYKSRPAGARGLKLFLRLYLCNKNLVAPRRGAWIETLMP